MPTVLQDGPYSFIFFSSERGEPPHIHVKRDRQLVKYWLEPVLLEKNRGFKDHELNQITKLVEKNQIALPYCCGKVLKPRKLVILIKEIC